MATSMHLSFPLWWELPLPLSFRFRPGARHFDDTMADESRDVPEGDGSGGGSSIGDRTESTNAKTANGDSVIKKALSDMELVQDRFVKLSFGDVESRKVHAAKLLGQIESYTQKFEGKVWCEGKEIGKANGKVGSDKADSDNQPADNDPREN